jgi:aryl-alcohol dehydrogenase-like predicted oxidoreductase
VHPISALQVEYSPFSLDIEDPKIDLLRTARELGVTIVAYSPLGRGILTGNLVCAISFLFRGQANVVHQRSHDDLETSDFRRMIPRYSPDNFPRILQLVEGIKKVGDRHSATSSQATLAWLLAQGDDVIPIPGTRKAKVRSTMFQTMTFES